MYRCNFCGATQEGSLPAFCHRPACVKPYQGNGTMMRVRPTDNNAHAIKPGFWLVRERLPRKRGEIGRASWGPLLPAAIMLIHTRAEPGEADNRMDRSPFFAAFVGGEPVSIYELQQDNDHDITRIFQTEQIITLAEYNFRIADLRHAQQWRLDDPLASPDKAINLMTASVPF